MVDYIDLVEEDQRVENGEGRIVQYSCEDYVLEVLKAVSIVYLPFDVGILNADDLLEFGLVGEVLPVICFVAWKVGIICAASARPCAEQYAGQRTLQGPHNTEDATISDNELDDRGVVEQDQSLHNVAQSV